MNHQISFKTLIYRCLRKWRTIIVMMLLFAVIAGAVSVARELSTTPEASADMLQPKLETLERQISHAKGKAAQVDALLAIQVEDNLAEGEENHSEAFFAIKIDSPIANGESDVAFNQSLYSIKLEEIKYLYYALINNLTVYDDLISELKMGIDSYQLQSLVSQSYKYNSLLLTVSGFDAKTNSAVRDAMVKKIQRFSQSINSDGYTHTLQVLETSSSVVHGTAWHSTVTAAKEQKKEINAQLKQLESQVAEFQATDERLERLSIGTILFYVAVGLLCGCIMGILLVFSQVMASTKIYGLEDLENGYNIPTLGEIYFVDSKKRHTVLTRIDRAIDLMFYAPNKLRVELSKKLLLQSINSMAGGGQKLLCVVKGTEPAGEVREVLNQTVFSQAENEFSSSSTCEILIKQESGLDLKTMDACTGFLIFTTYASMTFSELNRLLETAAMHDKPVLGLVGVSIKEQV